MILKKISGLRHVFPFFGAILALGIISTIVIQGFIRHSGTEILNSWLETEAIQIQEGNFLASLSRFSRTILSSKVVTSVTLLSVSSGRLDVLVSYGEKLNNEDICKIPTPQQQSLACTRGLFHEVIVYRPETSPKLILVFESKPVFAYWAVLGIISSLSLVSVFFMSLLKRGLARENDERLFLVRKALEELISNEQPSSVLQKDFPNILQKWQEMRQKIEILKHEIVEASKEAAIGRISSQLTHDMRAPIGTFERLLSTRDEDWPKMHNAVRESVNRLYTMVEALRLGELENIIKKKRSDLDFSYGYQILIGKAQRNGIHFKIMSTKIEQVYIDPMKVERAWINLASNAIEFAKNVVIVETEINGEDIYIRIIDDGPGVPAEFLPKLFQRGATFGKHEGTGLGLAYVRQIMRGHGGDVSYRREGDLTVFECYLPNVVIDNEDFDSKSVENQPEPSFSVEIEQTNVQQVSICFRSADLSRRVYERLSKITQNTHSFTIGFDQKSSIVLTDSEETAEMASEAKSRPILMSSLSDDEIVRRAPIRLGMKG